MDTGYPAMHRRQDKRLHVKISGVSVPPDVGGDCIGEVLVYFHAISWKYRGAPEQTQLRIKWWGETGDGTVAPLHPSKGGGATFPVAVGPKWLCKYLRDMSNMDVSLEESPSGRPIGTVTLPVARLDVSKPVQGTFPLIGPRQQELADCTVSLTVSYTGLSSFEFNEHRASTDPGLPILPGRASQQRAALLGPARKAAPPAAAAVATAPSAAAQSSSGKDTALPTAAAATAVAAGKENAPPPAATARGTPAAQPTAAASAGPLQEHQQGSQLLLQPQQTAAQQQQVDKGPHATRPSAGLTGPPALAAMPQPFPAAAASAVHGAGMPSGDPAATTVAAAARAAAAAADPLVSAVTGQLPSPVRRSHPAPAAAATAATTAAAGVEPMGQQHLLLLGGPAQQRQASQQAQTPFSDVLRAILHPSAAATPATAAVGGGVQYQGLASPAPPAAAAAAGAGLLYGGPAALAPQATNQQGQTAGPLWLLPAGAAPTAAPLSGVAAPGSAGVVPVPQDALLDIIHKAEQLQLAMQQATARGLQLALSPPRHQHQQQLWSTGGPYPAAPGLQPAQQLFPEAPTAEGGQQAAAGQQLRLDCLQQDGQVGGRVSPAFGGLVGLRRHPAAAASVGPAAAAPAAAGALVSYEAAANSRQQAHRRQQQPPDSDSDSDSGSGSSGSGSGSTGSTSGSEWTEMEDLEDLEDLLLEELFFAAPAPPTSHPTSPTPGGNTQQQQPKETRDAAVGQSSSRSQQPAKAGQTSSADWSKHPRLSVQVLAADSLQLLGEPCHVEAVVRGVAGAPAGRVQLDDLLQQHPGGGGGGGASGGLAEVVVLGPPELQQPLLPWDHPTVVLELWCHRHTPSHPAGDAAGDSVGDESSQLLLGIAKVPLTGGAGAGDPSTAEGAGGLGPYVLHSDQLLAAGWYTVRDILAGVDNGRLLLAVTHAPPPPAAADSPAGAARVQGQYERQGQGSTVLAIRHTFEVSLGVVGPLPDVQQLQGAGLVAPVGRFLCYLFPGEGTPLYTQEVAPSTSPSFDAAARHSLLLRPGEGVLQALQETAVTAAGDGDSSGAEGGEAAVLLFQLYNKWGDDSDSLCASCSLPLAQLADLTAQDHPQGSSAAQTSRTFLLQLGFEPGTSEAQLPAPGPVAMLQVTVSYSAVSCYSLEEDDQQEGQQEKEDEEGGQGVSGVSGDLPTPSKQQGQSQACSEQPAASDSPSAGAAAGGGGSRTDSAAVGVRSAVSSSPTQHSPAQPRRPPLGPAGSCPASPAGSPPPARTAAGTSLVPVGSPGGAGSPPRGGALQLGPYYEQHAAAAAAGGGVEPLTGELCVEVVRACGLQAAVVEAQQWLGGGSSLLGRARSLGPHPYVTLELFGGDQELTAGVPPIKTPFQAQTFCPQFHHRQVLPLVVTRRLLAALANGELSLSLWHHCPRSQAVAAALAQGQPSGRMMAEQQQVLLGSGTTPLAPLLLRPQGLRTWLVLKSRRGQGVGAVQVAVYWSQLGGQPQDTSPAAASPLQRFPNWVSALPLSWWLLPLVGPAPAPGCRGQLARLTLTLDALLLPEGEELVLERPRMAGYSATYKLPACSQEVTTPSRCCTAAEGSGLLARSWQVPLAFTGLHWVAADTSLAQALLRYPLTVSLTKHEPARRRSRHSSSSGGGSSRRASGVGEGEEGQDVVDVPLGVAEVDLSPLLAQRPGPQQPNSRWLSGSWPVIHPLSKSLGNCRLKVKVLLELDPPGCPPPPDTLAGGVGAGGGPGDWYINPALLGPALLTSTAPPQAEVLGGIAEVESLGALPAPSAAAAAGGREEDAIAEGQDGVRLPSAPPPPAAAAGQGEAAEGMEAEDEQGTLMPSPPPASKEIRPAAAAAVSGEAAALAPVKELYEKHGAASTAAATTSSGQQPSPSHTHNHPSTSTTSSSPGPMATTSWRRPAEVASTAAPSPASSSSSPAPATTTTSQGQRTVGTTAGSPQLAGPPPAHQQGQQQLQDDQEALQQGLSEQQQQEEQGGQQQQGPNEEQQQQQEVLVLVEGPGGLAGVQLAVEEALHLQLDPVPPGHVAALYLSYHWPCTPTTAASWQAQTAGAPHSNAGNNPGNADPRQQGGNTFPSPAPLTSSLVLPLASPVSGDISAQLLYSSLLPWWQGGQQQQQQQQQQGGQLGQAHGQQQQAESGMSAQQSLQLQVWQRNLSAAAAAALAPLYCAGPCPPAPGDLLLGRAGLDLTLLSVLPLVEGWYNIDIGGGGEEEGGVRGQLKVTLKLLELPTPLPGGANSRSNSSSRGASPGKVLPAAAAAAAHHRHHHHHQQGGGDSSRSQPSDSSTRQQLWTGAVGEVPPGGGPTGLAAAAAAAGEGGEGEGDQLDQALRRSLQDLDAISSRLATRLQTAPVTHQPAPTSRQDPSPPMASAAPPAEAPQGRVALHQLQTCSDDEQCEVVDMFTESEPDTEELMGQVDWNLPCDSDDLADLDTRPGPPPPAQPPAAAAAAQQTGTLTGGLTWAEEDWMFCITAPAANTPRAAAGATAASHGTHHHQLVPPGQAAAAAADVGQQEEAAAVHAVHDPRALPAVLDQRLDALLASFQEREAPPLPQQQQPGPSGAQQRQDAATGAGAARGDSTALHDEDDEFLPAVRSAYSSAVAAAARAADGSSRGFVISNSLPPIPSDFKLEYSDRPLSHAAGVPVYSLGYAAPPAAGGEGVEEEDVVSEASSFDERALGLSCGNPVEAAALAAAGVGAGGTLSSAAAAAEGSQAGGGTVAARSSSSSAIADGTSSSSSRAAPAVARMAGNDDLFSFSKRPARGGGGGARGSSGSGGGGAAAGGGAGLAGWSHPGAVHHPGSKP